MKNFYLSALLTMIVCANGFAQTAVVKREFRGVWVATVANIDWPSSPTATTEKQQSDLITLFDKLAASGCNAVIFQVRSECDAMYDSPYDPWSYWLTGQQGRSPVPYYDPLKFAVEEAHKRGMELHAWFNPYRAERSAGGYITDAKHVTKQHPDWVLQVGTIRFLNPGLQAVRDYDAKVIADVVRRYDIDAAHMDDYFYVEGTTTQDAAAYAADPRGLSLGDWRRDNVNRLLKQVYDSIQVIKPNVRWGISPAGIYKNGVPSGIIGNDNYSVLYCDPVAWMAGKYIDYLAPQLYWKTGGNQDYVKLQTWWASQTNGRHLYPGLAIYRIGTSSYGNAGMPASQIRFNRSTPDNAQGAILYTANNITGNTGGITDTLTNDLWKYKAIPPRYAWKDSVKPNAPQNLRYAKVPGRPIAQLMWDLPLAASDGDTANKYVVYRFDHGTVSQSEIDDARNINVVTSLRSITPSVSAQNQTVYFVVTSLDQNNNESVMSGAASISVPGAPLLALPVSGAANQPQGVNLSWNSVGSASLYQLQVSPDSTFASGFIVNDASLTDSVKSVTGLSGQQKYYWRVRGLNAAGTGPYGETRAFTTGFPSTPMLALPANFFLNATFSGTLAWMKNPSAQAFRVQLSTTADFSTTIIDTSGVIDTTVAYANLAPVKIHFWRVAGTNPTGVSNWSDMWRFRTAVATAVERQSMIPTEFALGQNYPNPFNPETNIQFSVSSARLVQLTVYDVLGRTAASLVNETMQPGTYTVSWNAAARPSGIYFYRLSAGNFMEVKKMLLQK